MRRKRAGINVRRVQERRRGPRWTAALTIQFAWRRYVFRQRCAQRRLVRLLNVSASRIQRCWRCFVRRLNDRAPTEFCQWLHFRQQRIFYEIVQRVRIAAIRRRRAAFIIGTWSRRCLLHLRCTKLAQQKKIQRIQRWWRRKLHHKASELLVLRCHEIYWLFRCEKTFRDLRLKEEAGWRRQLGLLLTDRKANMFAPADLHCDRRGASTNLPPPHRDFSPSRPPAFHVPCRPGAPPRNRKAGRSFLRASVYVL
jgi:hypothetical protein